MNLSIPGEQASFDVIFAYEYNNHNDGYSYDQAFNCDETGLQYRLLPRKTYSKRAEGRKKNESPLLIHGLMLQEVSKFLFL